MGSQLPTVVLSIYYRLTEGDFSDLEDLLQHWLSQLLPRYGLARVAGLSGFAESFVLYAAEWWRRRYDGSGFSWEPILHDLGADPEEWSPTQRSEFVRQGFRGWRIRPRESGGDAFHRLGGCAGRPAAKAAGQFARPYRPVVEPGSASGVRFAGNPE